MTTSTPKAAARSLAVLGAVAVLATALLATLLAGPARGERAQFGVVIVSLDGGISPLRLPRSHPAPVSVRLSGGLQTSNGSTLPRVTRIELSLAKGGYLFTRGLPVCAARRLQDAKVERALAVCGAALVGHGMLRAAVLVPHQPPFGIKARLLAFNARTRKGAPAVLMYGFTASPPAAVVIPFRIRRGGGRFGTSLVARLPAALGPWPRFAHFDLTFGRRYRFRSWTRSYLNATCPAPRGFTAGFLTFARVTFTIADGRRIGTEIVRSCRAP